MRNRIRQYLCRDDGSFSVETALIFPILAWAFGAMLVFWDGFKLNNNAISGTYTVADLVSRQTAPVTPAFLGGLDDVFERVTQTPFGTEVRVTVVRLAVGPDPVLNPTELELVWSHGTSGMPALTTVGTLEDIVPLMAVGASIVMVETAATWEPPLEWIVRGRTFTNRVFTSPRFVPQIKFDDGTTDGTTITLDDGSA